jgi:hypothetical protein
VVSDLERGRRKRWKDQAMEREREAGGDEGGLLWPLLRVAFQVARAKS